MGSFELTIMLYGSAEGYFFVNLVVILIGLSGLLVCAEATELDSTHIDEIKL